MLAKASLLSLPSIVAGAAHYPEVMANADYIRRKVSELKEQATRLGSDAVDSLRGSRVGASVVPTFEELRERARRSEAAQLTCAR